MVGNTTLTKLGIADIIIKKDIIHSKEGAHDDDDHGIDVLMALWQTQQVPSHADFETVRSHHHNYVSVVSVLITFAEPPTLSPPQGHCDVHDRSRRAVS